MHDNEPVVGDGNCQDELSKREQAVQGVCQNESFLGIGQKGTAKPLCMDVRAQVEENTNQKAEKKRECEVGHEPLAVGECAEKGGCQTERLVGEANIEVEDGEGELK